jgi:amino acid permease
MDYSFLVLVISIFASRFIQLNAFKNLKDEDKGKVLSKNIMQLSQVSLVFSLILIVAFYFLIGRYPDNATTLASSFFIALIVQRIVVYLLARKRMIDNNVPESYLTKYFFSWLVVTIGVALFIVLFMWQFNHVPVK